LLWEGKSLREGEGRHVDEGSVLANTLYLRNAKTWAKQLKLNWHLVRKEQKNSEKGKT